jgi:hypothetical protein
VRIRVNRREYYRVLIETPPLNSLNCLGMGPCQYLGAQAPLRLTYQGHIRGGDVKCWQTDMIRNTPMLEPGRKRHPLSIIVLCSVGYRRNPRVEKCLRIRAQNIAPQKDKNCDAVPAPTLLYCIPTNFL